MLPPERRLVGIRDLIDERAYFVIHAPRQTGKTTSFAALAQSLTAEGGYAAALASVKVGETAGSDVERGVNAVMSSVALEAEGQLPEALRPPPPQAVAAVAAERRLGTYLARWCERCPLPVVLFLDEIDALVDDTLLSVLSQLHAGYRDRPERFPHALALIGLRDVRDYKIRRRRGGDHAGTSSPFNIKAESFRIRDFTADEVAELYAQHTEETGQEFTGEAVALAFELTRGQPWLVNNLARQAVRHEVPDVTRPIDVAAVEAAREALIRRRDTHLDSLVDRLREARVRRVIAPILTGALPDEVFDDDVPFTKDLGLVATGPAGLEVVNPIYREIVPRALTALTEEFLPVQRAPYIADDGSLRWPALLDGFIDFWREHAEHFLVRQPYSEAAAQLIFMAYLHRIVNGAAPAGTATIDREYAAGSGRIDLVVRWPLGDGRWQRFAVELKVWHEGKDDPKQAGLDQLADYLDRLGLDAGTLVLFDRRSKAVPLPQRIARETVSHRKHTLLVLRL